MAIGLSEIIFIGSVFLTLYVGIGYNFLIRIFTMGTGLKKNEYVPPITVIIPAFNEERRIERKLENLVGLDYPKDKISIVIVAANCSDKTEEISEEFFKKKSTKKVKIMSTKRGGKIYAINKGLRESNTDIVAITDADVVLKKDALKSAVSFLSEEIGAVNGMISVKSNQLFYSGGKVDYHRQDWEIRYMEGLLDSCSSLDGKLIVFKRSIIPEIPENAYSDDLELTILIRKKGYRCIVDKNAIVYEYPASNLKQEVQQMRRRTALTIATISKHLNTLFGLKSSYYGFFILPSRRILPLFLPLIMLYVCYFIFRFSFILFILIFSMSLIISTLKKNIAYNFILIIAISLGWYDFFCGNLKKGAKFKKIKLDMD